MAKKSKKSGGAEKGAGRGKQAAKAGLGALLVGALVWLTGGFSRDNGLEWVKSITIAVGLALLIRWPVGEPYRIPSGSMETTLHGDDRIGRGDRVWVNKFCLRHPFPPQPGADTLHHDPHSLRQQASLEGRRTQTLGHRRF